MTRPGIDVERMARRHMQRWDGITWDGGSRLALEDFARTVLRAAARIAEIKCPPCKSERIEQYLKGRREAAHAIRHAARTRKGK